MHCQSPRVDSVSLSTSLTTTDALSLQQLAAVEFGALLVSYMPLGCHTKLLPCRPLIVRLAQGRSLLYPLNNSTCDAGISGSLVTGGNHCPAHTCFHHRKSSHKNGCSHGFSHSE